MRKSARQNIESKIKSLKAVFTNRLRSSYNPEGKMAQASEGGEATPSASSGGRCSRVGPGAERRDRRNHLFFEVASERHTLPFNNVGESPDLCLGKIILPGLVIALADLLEVYLVVGCDDDQILFHSGVNGTKGQHAAPRGSTRGDVFSVDGLAKVHRRRRQSVERGDLLVDSLGESLGDLG
jgi:hypothetical protein